MGRTRRSGYVAHSGATTSGANFVHDGESGEAAAAPGRRREPEAEHEQRGLDRVVRARARDVLREGIRGPGERERRRQAPVAVPQPDEHEPEQAGEVEDDRREVRRVEGSPFPCQPKIA